MKARTTITNNPQAVLLRVKQMLSQGQAEQALDLLNRSGGDSPAVRNARGVCLLRMGKLDAAKNIFRDLVFPDGALAIPQRTPTVFRTNYITALLLLDNLITGISLLYQIRDETHPEVINLKFVIREWKRTFPWWRRLPMLIGYYPARSLRLGSEPGRLWHPDTEASPEEPNKAAA